MDRWKYRAIPALAVIVFGVSCFTVAAEQKRTPTFGGYGKQWRSQVIGGGGGAAFTAQCENNHFLTGIEFTTDNRINSRIKSVRPLCVEYAEGKLGKPERGKSEYGTPSETKRSETCSASDPVINQASVSADGFDIIGVWMVSFRCGRFATQQPIQSRAPQITIQGQALDTKIGIPNRAPRRVSGYAACPGGYVANGIHGRAGLFIDGFGLMCTRLPSNAPGQQLDVSFYHRLATQFRGSGMALDTIPSGPRANFTILRNGNFTGQNWALQFVSEGTYKLHTEFRGEALCLELINGGANNNQPQFQKCSTSEAQLWKLDPEGGTYRIKNALRGSDMCLDVINGGANNNQPHMAKCGNFTGQRWFVTRTNRNAPIRGVN